MLKIYASGIQDLTVARYFAAMEVDLAGFGISANNLLVISSIKEWIQGPATVAEPLQDEETASWQNLLAQTNMDYVLLPPGEIAPENIPSIVRLSYGTIPEKNKICVIELPEDLKPANFAKNIYAESEAEGIYFDIPEFTDEWLSVFAEIQHAGLVIKAGAEERPGIKSFETIDALFEKLGR